MAMRGQGKQIDRDASVQAVVKAATDGREFQRAAQATKASAASGSEERGDAYSRVMCSRLDAVAILELPGVRARPRARPHPPPSGTTQHYGHAALRGTAQVPSRSDSLTLRFRARGCRGMPQAGME